ncbi:TniQ family protein [Vibrio plantisponsor]|uniref:TniQ family protein n=1 Tax=Vibrio TaxID=662 RepID=UPI00370CD747
MLLQRPKPYPDESLESFFIRVANKNGYDDIQRFLEALKRFLIDKNPRQFQTFPTNICKINPYSSKNHSISRTNALLELSHMTFNEPANLLGMALNRNQMKFSPSTTALIRNAEVIPRSLLLKDSVPCCPICLNEKGYANYRWHFSGYDYCHEHNVKLVSHCICGAIYDYRNAGLSGICPECGEVVTSTPVSDDSSGVKIASWLSGFDVAPLPIIPQSYRWGLIHWWSQMFEATQTSDSEKFMTFWEQWPNSFHDMIETEIESGFEYAVVSQAELRIKDVLGKLLFSSIKLPDRNFRSNIILKELFQYLEAHLWDNDGRLANLRLNTSDICIVLNCSKEQVASMVKQRILIPTRHPKSREILIDTDYVFYFGDIYCLWLSECQTDEFNRYFYVSRW